MSRADTAVVLAAGRGRRLEPGFGGHRFCKPLIRVAGRTLLERVVHCCRSAGLARIIVITGFRDELIDEEIARWNRGDVHTIHNDRWRAPNGVSLLAARPAAGGDFVLLMADHLLDQSILDDVAAAPVPPSGATLAVDRKLAEVYDLNDATKVSFDGRSIQHIGKRLGSFNAVDCGVFRCTAGVFDALDATPHSRAPSVSDGMRVLARTGRLWALDIGDRWWEDVDTPAVVERVAKRA